MNIDKNIMTEKNLIVMSRVALNEYEVEKGVQLNLGKRKAFIDGFEKCWRLIDDAPTIDQWKYPSRGELPEKGREVWDGYDIVYYLADLKKWCRFDDDEPIKAPYAWCYLPDPPKEEA